MHVYQRVIFQIQKYQYPESFARGGLILTGFVFDERREDPNSTKSRPSSARQQNAILMAFGWQADDGPTLNAVMVAL